MLVITNGFNVSGNIGRLLSFVVVAAIMSRQKQGDDNPPSQDDDNFGLVKRNPQQRIDAATEKVQTGSSLDRQWVDGLWMNAKDFISRR